MLNQSVLVGRITEIEENDITKILISIPRSFKNKDGEYDTDILSCIIPNCLAKAGSSYLKINDLIGIKGRLQSKDNIMELVAEKITLLDSKNSKED